MQFYTASVHIYLTFFRAFILPDTVNLTPSCTNTELSTSSKYCHETLHLFQL